MQFMLIPSSKSPRSVGGNTTVGKLKAENKELRRQLKEAKKAAK